MNIIYLGNGLFSQKSLECLHTSKHLNILLVVSNDTKRQWRGLKHKNTPVSRFAKHHNIELLKTNNFKDSKNVDKLKKYNADIFIVIEYKILPKDKSNNAIQGRHLAYNSGNNLIVSPKKLIATVGLDNIAVIDTEDTILIINLTDSGDIKKLIKKK